ARAPDPPTHQRHQPGLAPATEAAPFQRRLQPPGRPPANSQECPMFWSL
ncbi:hypothetical protein, partial [Pseudomonas sp. FEN]